MLSVAEGSVKFQSSYREVLEDIPYTSIFISVRLPKQLAVLCSVQGSWIRRSPETSLSLNDTVILGKACGSIWWHTCTLIDCCCVGVVFFPFIG